MSQGFAAPPPGAPPAKPRPAIVTAANWLLLLVAALYVINFVVAVSQAGTWNDIYTEWFAGTEAEGSEGIATGIAVGVAGVNLLFAAGFVVLALLNNRGKNPARITTWVVGGVSLCCGGFGLLGTAVSGGMSGGGDLDEAELEQLIEQNLPSWYDAVTITTSVVSILALIVALILLALPPANEFFRKPAPTFEPPPDYPPPAA